MKKILSLSGHPPKFFSSFTLSFILPLLLGISPLFANPQPGDLVTSGSPHEKLLALTFDDGPGPFTEKFLNMLAQHQVKATFFLSGELVPYHPQLVKRMAEEGHDIGDHTFKHLNYKAVYKKYLSQGLSKDQAEKKAQIDLTADINKSKMAIEKASGKKVIYCRMPHGIDRSWIKAVAREEGYILINWTYGADWTVLSTDELIKGYEKALQPGAILLFHDGGKNRQKNLDVVEAIIRKAQEKGFKLVPVGKLLDSLH